MQKIINNEKFIGNILISRNNYFFRLIFTTALLFAAGLCIRLALEPTRSVICAIITFILFGNLFEYTKKDPWKVQIVYALLASLIITLIPFGWVYTGIRNITGFSKNTSAIIFILYALLFQIKIGILFPVNRLLSKYIGLYTRGIWLFIVPDLFFYQLFPWYWGNLLSESFTITQTASLVGIHGVSIIGWTIFFPLVFLSIHLFSSLTQFDPKSLFKQTKQILLSHKTGITAIFALIVSLYTYSSHRESQWKSIIENSKRKIQPVTIALVQPSIDISLNEKRDSHSYVQNAMQLSFNYGLKAIIDSKKMLDLLIFPESFIPYHTTNARYMHPQYNYSPTFHGIMTMLAQTGKQSVLYNESNYDEIYSKNKMQNGMPKIKKFNSITLMAPNGKRASVYHKIYLLPFGEYIPKYLEKNWNFRDLFPEAGTYSPDHRIRIGYYKKIKDKSPENVDTQSINLKLLDYPDQINKNAPASEKSIAKRYFAGMLCYEAMFPEYGQKLTQTAFKERKSLDFILNPVNDAWFGNTIENYQHLNSARFRAVETGIHLVRSALSGISVIIDPLGRNVSKVLHPKEKGIIIDSFYPAKIGTVFSLWGFIPVYIFLIVIIMITFIRVLRN